MRKEDWRRRGRMTCREDIHLRSRKELDDLLAATSQKRTLELAYRITALRPSSTNGPAAALLHRHNGEMDAYSKLDHATVVRNMNAVCAGLASAVNHGGFRHGIPPALTYGDLEDLIPLTLYRIAVAAGWIEEQPELTEDEYYNDKDADLFGGCLWLRASYCEWFLGLVADTLSALEADAEKNRAAQDQYHQKLMEYEVAWYQAKATLPPANDADSPAKKKIDEFRAKTKRRLFSFEDIAKAATDKSKADGHNTWVSRVSVSRIYNDYGNVSHAIREAVARLINDEVHCTREDLLPSSTPPILRSNPQRSGDDSKE